VIPLAISAIADPLPYNARMIRTRIRSDTGPASSISIHPGWFGGDRIVRYRFALERPAASFTLVPLEPFALISVELDDESELTDHLLGIGIFRAAMRAGFDGIPRFNHDIQKCISIYIYICLSTGEKLKEGFVGGVSHGIGVE
jgi:hypothetical protein